MHLKNRVKSVVVIICALLLAGCATKSSYFRLHPALNSDLRNFDGFQYVPLTRLCDFYGLNCQWDTFVKTATIAGRNEKIVLRAGSDQILVNGYPKSISRPVLLSGGAVFVPLSFVKAYIGSILPAPAATVPVERPSPVSAPKKFSIKTIVLDTGHGGKDVGAIGPAYGTKEKVMALTLSNKIKSILERNNIRVIMTRPDDNFLSLDKRTDIANKSGADLFVSVHINASRSRSLKGFECYYLSNATDDNARALEAFEDASLELSDAASAERSQRLDKTLWDMALTENRLESGELAGYICSAVAESGLPVNNRGVRTARFYVLKHTHMPAVLVEAGYISNRSEESKLRESSVLDGIAEAVANGILKYKSRYEQTEGFTNV